MPIAPLMIEHRLIERMVKLMGRHVRVISSSSRADTHFIEGAVDFIRAYADRCHHGKEEDILFRELAGKKMAPAHAKIMEELLHEHVEAREVTAKLNRANEAYIREEPGALEDIRLHMSRLVEFYPVHIEKEDRHFFIPVMDYFTKQEQEEMLQVFYGFDRKLIHERYGHVVEAFEATATP
jgi:hemerythrin-like domain-containing protein